jgi:hypothetical protein
LLFHKVASQVVSQLETRRAKEKERDEGKKEKIKQTLNLAGAATQVLESSQYTQ